MGVSPSPRVDEPPRPGPVHGRGSRALGRWYEDGRPLSHRVGGRIIVRVGRDPRSAGCRGAYVGASDHGANKSVYAKDPDGLEFEVMWLVPPELWGDEEHEAIIRPLNIEAEQRRFADIVSRDRG